LDTDPNTNPHTYWNSTTYSHSDADENANTDVYSERDM
jgi:hypothetical protein